MSPCKASRRRELPEVKGTAGTSVRRRLNPAWGAGPTRRALGLSRGSDSVLGVNVRVGCS